MNLDAYTGRIGWTGARTPTPETLAGLLAHHMRSIPFENIDVLLGRPPRLDLPSLEAKLVTARRGGYCFEHCTLFSHVLAELGFTVHTHSARVTLMAPKHEAPRTHMFLTVGDVMLDPGFGGLAPRFPIPLDGQPVTTPAGEYRLVRDGAEVSLEVRKVETQRLWVSTLEVDHPIDYEMANHYTATHPRSHFTKNVMLRAFTGDDSQVRVMNRDVTFIRGGETQTRQLADRRELRAVVAEHFGFDMPELETLRVPAVADWT